MNCEYCCLCQFSSMQLWKIHKGRKNKRGQASFIPHVPTKAFKEHSTWERIQKSHQLLQPSTHAITSWSTGPRRSAVTFPFFFWSLHGTMSSASVPEDSRPRGSHWFPFHSSARRTAEQWGRKDQHYWKGSSGTSAFCQHQKAPMWAETRYAENLPEALNYRATSSIHSRLLWNKHSALPLPPRLLDAQKSNTTAPILKNAGAQSTRWEKHQL